MSATAAPLPPRDRMAQASRDALQRTERRSGMLMTVAFFIVGLSIVLSYNWAEGGFTPEPPAVITFAVLVAAIIYVAARYAGANTRKCPACNRFIPIDSVLCPYCGQQLP